MHPGVRRLRNGEEMREAILSALTDGPLSSREILIHVGATHTARCALDSLVLSGRVVRHGARVTFDYGHEILFRNINTPLTKNGVGRVNEKFICDACYVLVNV
jgi:hypothetical protein